MVDSVSPPKINSELGATVQRGLANVAHFARVAAFRNSMLFLVLAGFGASSTSQRTAHS